MGARSFSNTLAAIAIIFALHTSNPGGAWAARPAPLDTRAIERVLGMHGTTADGAFRVTQPREELRVTLDGFSITPRMGLTAWMAFCPHGDGAMLMGDIPLLEEEIQPVLSALAGSGVEVTALHNHFVRESPRVMFLHVGGMGDPLALARGLRAAFDAIARAHPGATPRKMTAPAATLDPSRLQALLRAKGEMKDGVFKATFARPSPSVTEANIPVTAALGLNSWAAFEGAPDRAAVAGDLALTAAEVNTVVRVLRHANIDVVAIHNHMLDEEPRIFFLHFWGVGRAEDLAKALRAALDRTGPPVS
jgi:hypothetical protein